MQITDYELFAVPPRWLLLKLETDEGIVGWGEPIVPGRLETARAAVVELIEGYLLGGDPRRVGYHWQNLYQSGYFRGGPILMSALAGIDQALWDIKGKHHGVPAYELLGGHVRDRVLVHYWLGGADPSDIAESARQARDQGFRAVKFNIDGEFHPLETAAKLDQVLDRLAAVRAAIGDEYFIGIDFHGRISKPMALNLVRRLEPYDPMFVDQPVLPEHSDFLTRLSTRTSIPIATGERFYSRFDFKKVLMDHAVSVIQPNVSHVGGISELKKIADMAEAFDVAVVPHCPLGPIAFAASLQVCMSSQNVVMQEQDLDLHDPESSQRLALLEDPLTFEFENGYVERPTEPGLGIEVDEATVREKAQADVNWYNPVWHHEDGSLAEW